jgi:6-phosphogluconolactonase
LGKFLFVTNDQANNLSAYSIDPSSGALSAVAGSPFGVGAYPQSVAIDPTGRFVYVANLNSFDVSAFAIDANSGALTPIPGSPFAAAGGNPSSVAIDPSGRFAYVGSSSFPSVTSFSIDAGTGALTQTGSTAMTGAGCFFASTKVDPTGKFVFMLSPCHGVYAFTADPNSGVLTLVAGSPVLPPTGWTGSDNSSSLAVEPTGRFVYVANSYSGTIAVLTIDSTTGALSQIPGSPFAVGGFIVSDAVDPSGKFLYLTNDGGLLTLNAVFGFTIDPTTGAPTPMASSPFATAFEPFTVVVTGKSQ